DLRFAGDIGDRGDGRRGRVADDDLEVFVEVVVAAELGAQSPAEGRGLPAGLEIDDLFPLERSGRDAEDVRPVQSARLVAGGNETVGELVVVEGPVQGGLAGDLVFLDPVVLGDRQAQGRDGADGVVLDR